MRQLDYRGFPGFDLPYTYRFEPCRRGYLHDAELLSGYSRRQGALIERGAYLRALTFARTYKAPPP